RYIDSSMCQVVARLCSADSRKFSRSTYQYVGWIDTLLVTIGSVPTAASWKYGTLHHSGISIRVISLKPFASSLLKGSSQNSSETISTVINGRSVFGAGYGNCRRIRLVRNARFKASKPSKP